MYQHLNSEGHMEYLPNFFSSVSALHPNHKISALEVFQDHSLYFPEF